MTRTDATASLVKRLLKRRQEAPEGVLFEEGSSRPDGLCEEAAAEISRLQSALEARTEECAKVAENDEAIKRLLPFCNDEENEAAETGQYEAGERIAAAIRKLQEQS